MPACQNLILLLPYMHVFSSCGKFYAGTSLIKPCKFKFALYIIIQKFPFRCSILHFYIHAFRHVLVNIYNPRQEDHLQLVGNSVILIRCNDG